jgi:hypothetical protein
MAKEDTQAEALAKNIDTETPVSLDTFTIKDAAHTQLIQVYLHNAAVEQANS